MNPPWVLIDLSYLAYRAMYSVGHLATEDMPTGVMFGCWEQLRTICNDPRIRSNKVIIFADSDTSVRKEFFPAYKQKRHDSRTEEEKARISVMWKQVRKLAESTFPAVGLCVAEQDGMESDDLIADAARTMESLEQPGLIITADADLYQSINPYVAWYDPKRMRYFSDESFRRIYGISPKKWALVKAMAGCASDNVPGLVGIGEKTSLQYLTGTLKHSSKKYKTIKSEEGREIVRRNLELVALPHKKLTHFQWVIPDYNPDAFWDFCREVGFSSWLRGEEAYKWGAFFSGDFSSGPRIRMRGAGLFD